MYQAKNKHYRTCLFWGLVLTGSLGCAFLSRDKEGGYDNVFLPACASLAILFALGAATVHTIIEQHGHRLETAMEHAKNALLQVPGDYVRAEALAARKAVERPAAERGMYGKDPAAGDVPTPADPLASGRT